jgi:hypothetical protein
MPIFTKVSYLFRKKTFSDQTKIFVFFIDLLNTLFIKCSLSANVSFLERGFIRHLRTIRGTVASIIKFKERVFNFRQSLIGLFWVFSDMQWQYVHIEFSPRRSVEGYEGQVAQWPYLQQNGAESSGTGSIRLAFIAAPHSGSCRAQVTFVPGPEHFKTDPDHVIRNTVSSVCI